MKIDFKREVARKGARITETERRNSKSAAAKRKGRRNEARLRVLVGSFRYCIRTESVAVGRCAIICLTANLETTSEVEVRGKWNLFEVKLIA